MQIDPLPTARSTAMSDPGRTHPAAPDPLRAVARDLEAAFLTEMLTHAGLGTGRDSFGGGPGEAQFASFLNREHAQLIVDRGGIGLAEGIYRALVARDAP